jgi:hemoglobin
MKRFAMLCLLLALNTPVLAADEVYQGLGQQTGIVKIVDTFVTLLQADSRVGHSFDEADIPHLKEKLSEQFCVLAGGPCRYTGKEMATIHDGLNITTAQFYALVEDLQIAMERHGIASRIQNKLLADLAPMQRDVVTR